MPSSEVYATIPYGEEEPDINWALLRTKGVTKGRLEETWAEVREQRRFY